MPQRNNRGKKPSRIGTIAGEVVEKQTTSGRTLYVTSARVPLGADIYADLCQDFGYDPLAEAHARHFQEERDRERFYREAPTNEKIQE